MLVLRRTVVLSVFISFIECSSKSNNHGLNITLFGNKQNIAFGINNTRLLPPILIIPVLIENSADHTTFSNKLNDSDTFHFQFMHYNRIDVEGNDIDVGFRQSLNRGEGIKNKSIEDSKAKITVRQSVTEIENKTVNMNITEKVIEENMKTDGVKNTTNVTATTTSEGLYPILNNSKEETNSISLTTTATDANLPPITDDRWQNFTVSTNLTLGNESTTKEPDSSTNRGPYPAALYNNGMIDQISITTNSYTNEESPLFSPKDDRWRMFSQKTEYSANEFKPLAGLYYDGFLHKPLIMLPGFVPRKYYNMF